MGAETAAPITPRPPMRYPWPRRLWHRHWSHLTSARFLVFHLDAKLFAEFKGLSGSARLCSGGVSREASLCPEVMTSEL